MEYNEIIGTIGTLYGSRILTEKWCMEYLLREYGADDGTIANYSKLIESETFKAAIKNSMTTDIPLPVGKISRETGITEDAVGSIVTPVIECLCGNLPDPMFQVADASVYPYLSFIATGENTASVGVNRASYQGCLIIPYNVNIESHIYTVSEIRESECCNSVTGIIIPKSVTSIEDNAFYGWSSLISVYLPDSVEKIGNRAFRNCISLMKIFMPDSVTETGSSLFEGCTSLCEAILSNSLTGISAMFFDDDSLTYVKLPEKLRSINSCAFENCTSLVKIDLPPSVKFIGPSAFENCRSLTKIDLPESLTWIDCKAFANCCALTEITIPSTTRYIYNNDHHNVIDNELLFLDAFFRCRSLKNIFVDPRNTAFCDMEGALFDKDMKIVMRVPGGRVGTYILPPSVENIHKQAFIGCAIENISMDTDNPAYCSIDGVVLTKDEKTLVCVPDGRRGTYVVPDTVISIQNGAFNNCKCLTKIIIPDSVKMIGDYAFHNCILLSSVTIPNSVTHIGDGAFSNCTSLTEITLPKSVEHIGIKTFSGCRSLAKATLPDSITEMKYSFLDCGSLTEVIIPTSVNNIDGAFIKCVSLARIKIPDSVKSMVSTFDGCSSLAEIDIPRSVTEIGINTFRGCSSLARITVPDTVTCIKHAFENCSSLKEIVIPSSVTNLNEVFADCKKLKNIFVSKENKVFTDIDGVLFYKGGNTLLRIPAGRTGMYHIPDPVGDIRGSAFQGCSLENIYVSPENPEYRSIDGVIYSKDGSTLIHVPASRTGTFVIPDSVTTVGDYAFSGCEKLKEVVFSDSVTDICSCAFDGCLSLEKIILSESLVRIENAVFTNCTSLVELFLPDSVEQVGGGEFAGSSSLRKVSALRDNTEFDYEAFADDNGHVHLEQRKFPGMKDPSKQKQPYSRQ